MTTQALDWSRRAPGAAGTGSLSGHSLTDPLGWPRQAQALLEPLDVRSSSGTGPTLLGISNHYDLATRPFSAAPDEVEALLGALSGRPR